MRYVTSLCAVALVTAAPAAAQNYAGSYATTNAAGVPVTLVLQQDAQGNLRGSLANPQFTGVVQGTIEAGEGAAIGRATFDQASSSSTANYRATN
jgi:hypothetical protein